MSASHFCPGQVTSQRYEGVAWRSSPPETIREEGAGHLWGFSCSRACGTLVRVDS
jgi:hypothetical protein